MRTFTPVYFLTEDIPATTVVKALHAALEQVFICDASKEHHARAQSMHLSKVDHIVWLKNAGNDVIACLPKWYIVTQKTPQKYHERKQHIFTGTRDDAQHFDYAINTYNTTDNAFSHAYKLIQAYTERHKRTQTPVVRTPRYNDGLMGFIGYDYSAGITAQGKTKHLSEANTKDQVPCLFFGHYDVFFQRENNQWQLCINDESTVTEISDSNHSSFEKDNAANMVRSELVTFITEKLLPTLEDIVTALSPSTQANTCTDSIKTNKTKFQCGAVQATWTKAQYAHAFEKVQNYLKAGDCYQVNLAQRFTASYSGAALEVLPLLEQMTDAPYAGYIRIADFEMISCSPELFIDFVTDEKGSTEVITKPIKGTLPRLADAKKDAEQIKRLRGSEKNVSENLMIVDLLRNDLSVFAKTGSVNVPKLFAIESFAQVHHMVSTIIAELADGYTSFDLLTQALPGGSITGAPKIRAIEIIEEMEQLPRGAYCGSMGFLNFDGTGSFNILIRTLQFYKNTLSLWAGGGITIASDCDEEYQECYDKVSGILAVLAEFSVVSDS